MPINNPILGISNNLHVNVAKKAFCSHRVPHYLLQWEHLIISRTLGKTSNSIDTFLDCALLSGSFKQAEWFTSYGVHELNKAPAQGSVGKLIMRIIPCYFWRGPRSAF